jgi:hypothetical protein
MYDYVNYFPSENVKNLDFVPLRNGKSNKLTQLTERKKLKTVLEPFK